MGIPQGFCSFHPCYLSQFLGRWSRQCSPLLVHRPPNLPLLYNHLSGLCAIPSRYHMPPQAHRNESSQSRNATNSWSPCQRIVTALQVFRYRLMSAVGRFVGNWLRDTFRFAGLDGYMSSFLFGWLCFCPSLFFFFLPFVIFLIPFFTLLILVSFIFTAVFGIITTSTICPGGSHVPSFYAPSTKSDGWSRMAVFALFGVIFGGLHCTTNIPPTLNRPFGDPHYWPLPQSL